MRKEIRFFLLVTLMIYSHFTFTQVLLFKSGFEPSVQLMPPVIVGNQWQQSFVGQDEGFDWSIDLPLISPGGAYWKYNVIDTATLSDYVETKLDTVTGPLGFTTNALFMNIKDWDSSYFGGQITGKVRSSFRMDWDTLRTSSYIAYWIKLQPDLYTVMPLGSDRWRYLMEWRESSASNPGVGDYRWNFQIRTTSNPLQPMYWYFSAEEVLGTGNFIFDWAAYDTNVAVPVGEWFKLEVYWNQAPDTTGRIWISVNDTVIIDRWGGNMKDTRINNWQPFKVYTSDECMDTGYNYQWIDDVEIWDTIPNLLSGIETQIDNNFINITGFPNPFTSGITFNVLDKTGYSYELTITDARGKVMNQEFFSGQSHQLDTREYINGVYFCRIIQQETGKTVNLKIIHH